jgi:hypothetical protein
MSFLFGKTTQHSNVNSSTLATDKSLNQTLRSGGGIQAGLFPSINLGDLQPYLDMFTLQRSHALAQAKEQAGNLTGSGFANILGNRVNESTLNENAYLADLAERRRTQNQSTFLQALSLALNSPAGGVSYNYRPGLLDYAGQAATGLATGGAFNPLFMHMGASGGGQVPGNMTQSGGR